MQTNSTPIRISPFSLKREGAWGLSAEVLTPILQHNEMVGTQAGMSSVSNHFFMYFQFRCFPSDIHSTAVSSLFVRVSSVPASVTQSTYSRFAL